MQQTITFAWRTAFSAVFFDESLVGPPVVSDPLVLDKGQLDMKISGTLKKRKVEK